MEDIYAVVGNPIAQSKSPRIHSLFAAQTGQSINYTRLEFPIDGFVEGVSSFFARGGKGANVTAPFKQDAYGYVHQTTKRARRAGAVNTIFLNDDGGKVGDTTDGVGLVRDLIGNLKWQVNQKTVLILGSGGAIRGVLDPLLEQKPAAVVIANRTASKARSLATAFSGAVSIMGVGLEALTTDTKPFDLVVNGTSSGLSGDCLTLPKNLLSYDTCCYDLAYGPAANPFLEWADRRNGRVADGLGMLVEQAAESFRVWRGVMPETTSVIQKLRQEMSS